MKRCIFSLLLSFLLLINLTACSESQNDRFVPDGSNDAVWAVVPEDSSPDQSPDGENFPDGSQNGDYQAPSNADQSGNEAEGNQTDGKSGEGNVSVDEDGWYTSKDEVALYIHLYGELPENYVTKAEAEDAGWSGGNVERYTGEGTAIGGSRFGNREGLLPKEQGRTYTECDIDTPGENSRGAKRIVFSNDGLVYYTDNHYESFELLYGEP